MNGQRFRYKNSTRGFSLKWWTLAFIWALDLGLAIFLTWLDARPDKSFMFLIALFFLWLVPLALGSWGLLKFWLCYHLFIKARLVKHYKVLLHKHQIPAGAAFFDHAEYLSFVMDSPDIDLQTKLKAAFFLGEITTHGSERPFTMGYAVPLAFRQAMDEYKP